MDIGFARRQMVRQQVRTCEVFDDETLRTLSRLERHAFVPPDYRDLAYAETEIPLACNQHMLMPMLEGQILQALDPAAGERALIVGAGSGFLAACTAAIADQVVAIDIYPELAGFARRNLDAADVANVEVAEMDATRELPGGEFDVVAVTASMQEFDPRLGDVLRDGGRLFVVVGDAPAMEARLYMRNGNELTPRSLFETCVQPMVNAGRRTEFSF